MVVLTEALCSHHGFTHAKPVETAREAIALLSDYLPTAYTSALGAR